MPSCRACSSEITGVYDVGEITPCNQFPREAITPERFQFSIGICSVCALVQTVSAPPADAIVPHVSWLRYNEPDGHINTLLSFVEHTFPINAASILGVGPFDEPFLQEAARRGHAIDAIIRDAAKSELPGDRYPYLETLATRLAADAIAHHAKRLTPPDVVVCRYLLEHCPDPSAALREMLALLAPGGTLVVEVPDSEKFLAAGNACLLWEEHLSYFTEISFHRLIERVAGDEFKIHRFEGVLEDALAAVITRGRTYPISWPVTKIATETQRYSHFCKAIEKARLRPAVGTGATALVGTGHHALMALQIYDLYSAIDILCDDDKHKLGRHVPGFARPIESSRNVLDDPAITTCILAVHPRSEARVIERFAPFIERGGTCLSLYAGSALPWALDMHACV